VSVVAERLLGARALAPEQLADEIVRIRGER
jgi:hypothetical protein